MTPIRTLRLIALTLSVTMWATGSAQGQPTDPEGAGAPDQEGTVRVYVGRSSLVRAPWPATRVSVTDPEVADLQVLTPDQVLVMGKSVGSTDLIMWSEQEEVWRARIDVDVDLSRLKADLARLFPESTLDISQSQEVVVVTGYLRRVEQAEQLHRFMDTIGLKHVDLTSVAGVQQVEISVRVAEASRKAIRALGINAVYTGNDANEFFGGLTTGSSSGGALVPISIGPPAGAVVGASKMSAAPSVPFTFNADVVVSPLVTLFGGFPRADLEFFLQALHENQYLRILAEPNLTALSGEEARFLAGGEFPIPVVQGGLGGGTASITIEYKEFGVRLAFRPVVLGDGGIRLRVATEMSELSDIGAVEIQGFRVPAVITRRAETTLEMNSGQTFGMAGLIQQGVAARNSRLPWLGDLPVLGALFRSIRYEHGETELLVLVTASLVEPLSVAASDIPTPGALHCPPNDWELYAEGRIEGRSPSKVSSAHSAWLEELGLDQLRGPGAWVTYSSPSAESFSTMRPSPAPPPGDTETNSTDPGPAEEAKVPT